MRASDWSRGLLTGNATADHLVAKGLRAQPEMTSPEVSLNRKSRDLGWETADQWEKSIVGSGWCKTAEEGGSKVQSPSWAAGTGIKREPQG